MASDQSSGGCLSLIGCLGVLGLFTPLMPVIVFLAVILLLAVACSALVGSTSQKQVKRLTPIVEQATRRFKGSICRLGDSYARIKEITTTDGKAFPSSARAMIVLAAEVIEKVEVLGTKRYEICETKKQLFAKPEAIDTLRSMTAFATFLNSNQITILSDLAVESKASQAAFQCATEREWAQESLKKLDSMIMSVRETLEIASGNELLAPSIPQLNHALERFKEERRKLQSHVSESDTMLRQLCEYLNVPETIRPILNDDIIQLADPFRLKDLQSSFNDVILLNEAYRDLSANRLA